jgi:hypothetical protein
MAKGVKHYYKDGTEHKGAMHKDAKGRLMSGAKHTKVVSTYFTLKIYLKQLRRKLERKVRYALQKS